MTIKTQLATLVTQSATGELAPAAPSADERASALGVLDAVVFYGVVILIGLTAIPYGTVEPWSQALFECAVFLLTLLWVIHGFVKGSWRVERMHLICPLVALVSLAIVQSLAWWQTDWAGTKVWYAISADPFETWAFVLRISALILACVLLMQFTSSKRRLGILVATIVAVAVASSVFGIARQTMQHSPGFFLPGLKPESGYGQFINKNHFGFLIEMAMGLVIGGAVMRNRRRVELMPLYLSLLLIMWAALVLSKSRGALLALAVEVIFAGLLFLGTRRSATTSDSSSKSTLLRWTRSLAARTIMVGVLLSILVGGVIWLGGDQLATGVETAAIEMAGVDPTEFNDRTRRSDIWRATWSMFKAHPLLGAGLGGYWAEVPAYHDGSGVLAPRQAHNEYLELLASGGIIGAALFVWFAIALIRQARENVASASGFQRAVLLGAIVGLVGVGVHSIVDFGLHITSNALVFVALLAIINLKALPTCSHLSTKYPAGH